MTRTLLLSLSFALLASCAHDNAGESVTTAKPVASSSDSNETSESEGTEATAATTASVLTIRAATLKIDLGEDNDDGPTSISIDAEGNMSVITRKGENLTVAKLHADGTITSKGKTLGSVDSEGVLTITKPDGSSTSAKISAEGVVTYEGKEVISIGEDGVLNVEDMSEKIVYEGPADGKQAMIIAFVIGLMGGPSNAGE
jgi:hypothetical protein